MDSYLAIHTDIAVIVSLLVLALILACIGIHYANKDFKKFRKKLIEDIAKEIKKKDGDNN